ncbi:hypothetical protein Tco_1412292 [Tanacetum coccineum]
MIVAQRVANDIETIAIYEAKTRVARDLTNQVKRQEDKVEENASNKKKWEGDHDGSSSQQQNKEHKMIRAHTTWLSNKKGYAKNLPLCTKCKFHHTGPCTENVAIASGLVIKLEIVGPQSRERNRGPQWQNRRPKLPVMSVKARTLQE